MNRGESFFEPEAIGKDLSQKAVQSGVIAVVARGAQAVLQIVSLLLLARLLDPEDFGLVAIIIALTSFAPMLVDLGLAEATVQRPRITPEQVSALFWVNLALGCSFALLLFLVSPLIARAYAEPRLAGIAAVSALQFVINSLSVQHLALLRRGMRFKDIAWLDISGSLGGLCVSIPLAALGFGYWALVIRPVVTAVIKTGGAWWRCDWRPGAPRKERDLGSMLRFGANVSVGAIVTIGANSIDRVLLGFFVSPRFLGFYQNALNLYQQAVHGVVLPLHNVGVSALSKLVEEPARLLEKYLAAIAAISFYSMPAFALFAVVAPDLVPLLLGSKWEMSGELLGIVALAGIFYVVECSQTWLHLPLGRADRLLHWSILTAVALVIGVVAGLPFGVKGVATGIVTVRAVLAIPTVIFAGRPIKLGVLTVLRAIGGPLLGAGAVLGVGTVLMLQLPEEAGRLGRIVLVSLSSFVVYAIVVIFLFRMRQPLYLGFSLLDRVLPKPFQRWLHRQRHSEQ